MIKPAHRFEVVVVSLVVILGALYARAEYIPPWAAKHLEIAGARWDLPVSEVGPWFSAWALGDGQAYALIASDPLGQEIGDDLREPAYRYLRAGYSWLAWAASGGQPELIPYALAAVGGLAVLGTLILAIWLRERLGPAAWFIVLNPALYIGFAGDTTEPLAILFLSLAMASDSPWAGAALGMMRADYLLATIGRWRALIGGVVGIGLIGYYAVTRFGFAELTPVDAVIDFPFAGFLAHPSPAGWLLAACAVATAVIGLRYRNWAWIVVGMFVVCYAPVVVADPVNGWRAAGMVPILWAFGPQAPSLQKSAVSGERPSAAPV